MPRYDVNCPNCGIYERTVSMADRREPCQTCGSPVEFMWTLSGPTKGFEPYFDYGLGEEVTGVGDRKQVMRRNALDYRDHPSKGEISARHDKINERKKAASARR